ncbi:branched-chain amino acid transaminase [bacterium]|nr:branched-chain amino acid transaminase [bacterium]
MTAFQDISGNTKVWKNGEIIAWKDATVHVMTHALHYGSSVFEGIRCYGTSKGPSVFRLDEHVRRLFDSAKLYRMAIPFSQDEFRRAILDTVRANGFPACYIRPIVFRGTGTFGVNALTNSVEAFICAWEWGAYLGADALEKGVNVMVSSWNRVAPNTLPAAAKCGANYASGQLIKMEASLYGFSEGIALGTDGIVSEGSGENVFLIRNGKAFTPSLASGILPGITRDCAMTILREIGYEVVEAQIPREMLYLADEIFFTGTAAEVTPVVSVDKIPIGDGRRGPITAKVQERYLQYVRAEIDDTHGWHTFV